ncbi:HNH endonuclease signature motif containing protein [Escherichia coli]|uniref:HNH endonuclease signature motif containing protein n=1 Tax=Escherichia coli TaxID=562 RepID=UPI000BE5DA88|nr:HNH endonuclease signature motif containing protein [Escherichia coli]
MNNEIKFQHIKRLWYLKDGVVFSRRTGGPVSFSSKEKSGRRFKPIYIDGKHHPVYVHDVIYMLHHDRAIAEGKEIHHIDNNHENNAVANLIELTRRQHMRIHQYQVNAPLRGIRLFQGAWRFEWTDDYGIRRSRCFHGINETLAFRAEIEHPRRQELRALGLNCKRSGNRLTTATMRQINKRDRLRYRCRH